jgi:DNA-binding transcriptional MerR regulator
MPKSYKTSEVAQIIGIHPNTVRLYEELGLIPKPKRLPNGYRVFTDMILEQFKLVRTALKVEVLQNGLRKKAIDIIKTSAIGDFDEALYLTECYLQQIKKEQKDAEEAITIAEQIIKGNEQINSGTVFTRKEVSDYLQITMDALRNWEMNGLFTIKRKKNGYRVYTDEDIRLLKIIRSLRCANYSLAAILRMVNALSNNPGIDIREVIDTPKESDDIISVCDHLITSLKNAENNAIKMLTQLKKIKKLFNTNPPL